jgi:hypothetical protein
MSADRYAGPHLVSLLISTKEVVGLSQASIDKRLLGLPGPYHRHAIAMFNTCSRGANPSVLNWHRRGLQSPKGLAQSQVIQSQHSLKWNGVKHLWLTRGLPTTCCLPKSISTSSNCHCHPNTIKVIKGNLEDNYNATTVPINSRPT